MCRDCASDHEIADMGMSAVVRDFEKPDTARRRHSALKLASFERLVLSQKPAETPWQPVTDYSFEARKAIEGKHPELIRDVFHPVSVFDVGCGLGHLVRLLRECGVDAYGVDREDFDLGAAYHGLVDEWTVAKYAVNGVFDLVICREVLEHLTVVQIAQAVRNLCAIACRFVYVTTRFAKHPTHLLDVDTSDDLDPTHISMLNQDLLRVLFVLEGFKRRADLEERMDWQKKGRCLVYERAS